MWLAWAWLTFVLGWCGLTQVFSFKLTTGLDSQGLTKWEHSPNGTHKNLEWNWGQLCWSEFWHQTWLKLKEHAQKTILSMKKLYLNKLWEIMLLLKVVECLGLQWIQCKWKCNHKNGTTYAGEKCLLWSVHHRCHIVLWHCLYWIISAFVDSVEEHEIRFEKK